VVSVSAIMTTVVPMAVVARTVIVMAIRIVSVATIVIRAYYDAGSVVIGGRTIRLRVHRSRSYCNPGNRQRRKRQPQVKAYPCL
jgi:hypothetical protein